MQTLWKNVEDMPLPFLLKYLKNNPYINPLTNEAHLYKLNAIASIQLIYKNWHWRWMNYMLSNIFCAGEIFFLFF